MSGPVPLVLDLHIDHDRFGSSSDPSINGHLQYPHDLDRSLNETVQDKIRQYHVDYNNRPSNAPTVIDYVVCHPNSPSAPGVCVRKRVSQLLPYRVSPNFLDSVSLGICSLAGNDSTFTRNRVNDQSLPKCTDRAL